MKLIVKLKKKGIFITFKGDGIAKIVAIFDSFIYRDHLRVYTKEKHFFCKKQKAFRYFKKANNFC